MRCALWGKKEQRMDICDLPRPEPALDGVNGIFSQDSTKSSLNIIGLWLL